ncbi:hypothetical protein F5972_08350 [Microbispora cellulosiformans]|uniref:Uncharacterized protein n=1 Tax=Microbispora cellulosiformans TaxID=2614688 RepID=A0A5J5K868_9ACTN|nr:hypothetical protein [Microbispora cellulosiformans]KAA9379653.1 hypothetical protein F5972_08350 [Microbispora cellulosiformans]
MWGSYLNRADLTAISAQDPTFTAQADTVRRLLRHLSMALDDEGITGEQQDRILRGVVYGTPDPIGAERRVRDHQRQVEAVRQEPAALRLAAAQAQTLRRDPPGR